MGIYFTFFQGQYFSKIVSVSQGETLGFISAIFDSFFLNGKEILDISLFNNQLYSIS